jgi:Domain of unknown function (DUF4062)
MLIFVSSTFVDLRSERDGAQEVLRQSELVPWGMELFVSQPSEPLSVCLEMVQYSDAIVLIIGFKAGSLIPERPELTYTRAEFDLAMQLGKCVIPFLKTEGGSWVNKETDPAKSKALDDFKKAVTSAGLMPAYFETTEELKTKLLLAVTNWNANGRPGARRVFTTPREFFAPFEPAVQRLFDFRQILRGRTTQLESLDAFLVHPTAIVGVLTGRGGIGKSKLLHDWVETIANRNVLYVREDAEWHGEAGKEIPAGDLLIVVDDAHRFGFLDRLFLLVRNLRQRNQNAKVVLGTRPSGTSQIDAALSIRLEQDQILRFPRLERIANQGVRELALESLGPDHAGYAQALATVSAETPLVTVVGGRLIARGDIAPALLANEEEFRHQVFDRFSEEYGRLLPTGAVNWRNLLNLVAAIGPLSPAAAAFVEPAAEILHVDKHEVISALDTLERHGLLLRGGRIVRIVPDLLSDFLLEGACLTAAGESTGFSDLVFGRFQSGYLSNVLRNLGELDWRITQRNEENQGARLLESIWNEIDATFEGGDAGVRVQLFKWLHEAALFQPARVLQLVRRALENEATTRQVLADWQVTQEHVVRQIPPLLKTIAFHFDYLEEAAEILWQLAQRDMRSPHQFPDHSRRVLEEMAEYGRYKPIRYNEWMVDFASRLAQNPQTFDGTFTPLKIVDKLLAKEGEFMESEGNAVLFGGFGLNYPVVQPVRERALRIIDTCLHSDIARIALAAMESLSHVLSGYLPMVGRRLSDDEAAWQMTERFVALDMVENRLRRAMPTPLLRQIRSVLRHARPHTGDGPLAQRIDQILSAIPQSDDLVIFDAFSTGAWDLDGYHRDIDEANRARTEMIAHGVAAFRARFPNGRQQLDGLIALARDADACGIEVGNKSYDFIAGICSDDFVEVFIPYVMNDPIPLLAYMSIVAFRWLRSANVATYERVGVEAATHPNRLLACGIADSIATGRSLEAPTPQDATILRSLVRHPASVVRQLTLVGIRRLGAHPAYERPAIEMLLEISVGDESKLGNEMCGAVDYAGIDKDHLTEPEVRALLDKLVVTKAIGEHHTERFLAWVGEHFPHALFELVLRRLDREAEFDRRKEPKGGYTPIPYSRFGNAFRALQNGPSYQTFLAQIRDRFATQPEQIFWLRELFWSIGSLDATTLQSIDELLHSGLPASVRVALALIENGPPELALLRPAFAVHVIEECGRVSVELGELAESVLVGNVHTGRSNRVPGHPSPKYTSIRDGSVALYGQFPAGSIARRLFARIRDSAIATLNQERLDDEEIGF